MGLQLTGLLEEKLSEDSSSDNTEHDKPDTENSDEESDSNLAESENEEAKKDNTRRQPGSKTGLPGARSCRSNVLINDCSTGVVKEKLI